MSFGLVPLALTLLVSLNSLNALEDNGLKEFEKAAVNLSDKIDRNLFERYGDVQAFSLNHAIRDRENWYDASSENPIVDMMNKYVSTYGIYYLTILVDLEGKVIGVNSKDHLGESIDVSSVYSKNYSTADWFTSLKEEKFTTSTPFSSKENTISTGTYIEDVHLDDDVKVTYSNSSKMTMGFSAPVYDENGEVIAYWSNRTKFSLVEEIVTSEYLELKKQGFASAELTVLDSVGRVILDFVPAVSGELKPNHNFESVLFKLNLVQNNVEAAVEAVKGETGHGFAKHARKI